MTELRDYTPDERARIAVADQLRRLSHELMRGDHSIDRLDALATRLGAEAEALTPAPERVREFSRFPDMVDRPVPGDGEAFFNSPDRPFSGVGHPFALPMHVVREGDRAVCELTLTVGFQGAPGMAHGGYVAAIYDDLLGFLLQLQGGIAFTASLTVNYRAGTPIGAPLRFEAWIDRIEGKKWFLAGQCHGGDALLTTCDALFIDATERFNALAEQTSG